MYIPAKVVRDDEALLIDMDTLCMGHPIFELASMFNAFVGFLEPDHEFFQRTSVLFFYSLILLRQQPVYNIHNKPNM